MRLLIFLVVLFTGFQGMTQGVISFPEYNILYRGYENIVSLGAVSETGSLILESDKISVTKQDSVFILRVSTTDRTAAVHLRDLKSNKIIGTWQFRILNFPPAVVSWGIYQDGSEVTLDQENIVVDYDGTAFFGDSGFEVLNYEVSSMLLEKPLRLAKGVITPEVNEALKKAKSLNNGGPVIFGVMVTMKCKDGTLRKRSAEFTF